MKHINVPGFPQNSKKEVKWEAKCKIDVFLRGKKRKTCSLVSLLTWSLWAPGCSWPSWSCSGPPGESSLRCWRRRWRQWHHPGPGYPAPPCCPEWSVQTQRIFNGTHDGRRDHIWNILVFWLDFYWLLTNQEQEAQRVHSGSKKQKKSNEKRTRVNLFLFLSHQPECRFLVWDQFVQ